MDTELGNSREVNNLISLESCHVETLRVLLW